MTRAPLRASFLTLAMLAFAPLAIAPSAPAFASEIKYVVNDQVVTSYDIQRRAAFLKLQRRKGANAEMAAQEMVDQAVRADEMKRLGIRVTDDNVNASFKRFAESNKLTTKQLTTALDQAGVTAPHFKEYIRSQMGWNQALSARMRSQGGSMSEQDVVRRMLQDGGAKPTATEYMLQQVIFVVPAADRKSLLSARRREAEALRQRFAGCDSTRQFVKGLVDVTIRDLGRVLTPELPADWAEQIKQTKVGGATGVRETDRGVEFIGICRTREVSDDRVAKMVFQAEGSQEEQVDEMSKKYTEELRKRARIVQR